MKIAKGHHLKVTAVCEKTRVKTERCPLGSLKDTFLALWFKIKKCCFFLPDQFAKVVFKGHLYNINVIYIYYIRTYGKHAGVLWCPLVTFSVFLGV